MPNSDNLKAELLEDVIASLKDTADADGRFSPAPVHLWNPPHARDIDMHIHRDGGWWHEGGPIKREKLVRLFASILKREGDQHFLVTPHEKVIVHVEDAPFVVIRLDKIGDGPSQTLVATTNVGDVVTLDLAHPLTTRPCPDSGETAFYLQVRNGLEARVGRAPYYELVDWLEMSEHDTQSDRLSLSLWSAGTRFELGVVDTE